MTRDLADVPAAMLMRHSIAGSRDAKRRTVGKFENDHQSGLTHSTGLFCAMASPVSMSPLSQWRCHKPSPSRF